MDESEPDPENVTSLRSSLHDFARVQSNTGVNSVCDIVKRNAFFLTVATKWDTSPLQKETKVAPPTSKLLTD